MNSVRFRFGRRILSPVVHFRGKSSGIGRFLSSVFRRRLSVVNSDGLIVPQGTTDSTLVKGAVVKWKDPSALNLRRRGMIRWREETPKTALLIKKRRDPAASRELKRIGEWLQNRDVHVIVEKLVKENEFPDFEVELQFVHFANSLI